VANRVRNKTISVAACLSGCLVAFGLSGCVHRRCCHSAVAKEVEPAAASAEPVPVPGALEYPRFHPVPTRPVFLPQGIAAPPAEVQLVPTEPPSLTAVPSDGWRPPRK